ncbi:HNH endonuclease [Sulfurimonas sp. HSL-1656]|uniref:HNH endonuclease signature motif containing protein n=1 Tax=Thiomicrolovo subterrani TaxID=3131934 RepID=UPI0031F9AACD
MNAPYTKAYQTKHARIKPKPARDRDYLNWFAQQPHRCLVCGTPDGIEGHHVKRDSSDQKDDHKMIPLCQEHHTGPMLSPHGTPRRWREEYSMEFQEQIAAEIYAEYCGEVM